MDASIIVVFFMACFNLGLVDSVTAYSLSSPKPSTDPVLQYFAIGSNMVPATMTSLRRLSPVSATAAVLPGYALAFDIPGGSFIEPSAASVVPNQNELVHGVLYELTETDFYKLGQSEGVPWVYTWEQCRVIPYQGDGDSAGLQALQQWQQQQQDEIEDPQLQNNNDTTSNTSQAAHIDKSIAAFVLRSSPLLRNNSNSYKKNNNRNIPPSRSYWKILCDGAAYWKLDRSYQDQLANVEIANNPKAIGISGLALRLAQFFNPQPPPTSRP